MPWTITSPKRGHGVRKTSAGSLFSRHSCVKKDEHPDAMDKTVVAVRRQVTAMGCDVFEVGLFKPHAQNGAVMLPRTWDADTLLRSLAWLRRENRDGRSIYIRPKGEHNLSLVDDLTRDAVAAMKRGGFSPALVVETSPRNYQAWLKHPEQLHKELSTAAARTLAEKFGGDRGAADWRHFGRLAGFTNRKQKYMDATTALYPYVKLIEAEGRIYSAAPRFLAGVNRTFEERKAERDRLRNQLMCGETHHCRDLKSIEAFRANPRYAGDGTRIDLAYALYAFSRGATEDDVRAAISSRDLSHKGSKKRQDEYVERTLKKAAANIHIGERGR